MKKLICKHIFGQVEVIKAFMKTKENGEDIYKMLNAWLSYCRSIIVFMQKVNKGYIEKTRKKTLGQMLSSF